MEEIKRQEQLKRHRIKSRERYQKIKAGEHAVGQPFTLTCECCGQEFASKRTNTLFCGPNCRAKFYRQEAAESRSRAWYLRKLRQGVYHNEVRCEILQ